MPHVGSADMGLFGCVVVTGGAGLGFDGHASRPTSAIRRDFGALQADGGQKLQR